MYISKLGEILRTDFGPELFNFRIDCLVWFVGRSPTGGMKLFGVRVRTVRALFHG